MKKHIVKHGYETYAFDTVSAAAEATKFFSKLRPVKMCTDGKYETWAYEPDPDRDVSVTLELDQRYRDPNAAKPRPFKVLALPAPKRGAILCICEHSYVIPRETCPHCGRPFSDSHNRTHAKP